jgi:flagellar hook-associated protein 1 FlgK
MLGLFGTLNLGTRALQANQKGVEVAGHNLANVNNPAYTRQRLAVTTSTPMDSTFGPQGTGVAASVVEQLRNSILDSQVLAETSISGSLNARQEALGLAQSSLGQQIAGVAGGSAGLAGQLSGLFEAFQSVSTNPSSLVERTVLLSRAADLSATFQKTDGRLAELSASLDQALTDDTTAANDLLGQLAELNNQIGRAEVADSGQANDLRDLRQQKLESLSRIIKFETSTTDSGGIDISVAGTTLVSGGEVVDRLEPYTAADGRRLVRTQTAGTELDLTGGTLHGTIDVRDSALASLRRDLNTLASELITEVNALHRAGFGLNGETGADFFTGTMAADLAVNADLRADPARLQLSTEAGASGNGTVALNLAQLAQRSLAGLGNQTLIQHFSHTVAEVGQSLASVEEQLSSQALVGDLLIRQRQSVSGVSLDEEMTDLVKFQKAYTASARLITTVDEMLDDVINLKR